MMTPRDRVLRTLRFEPVDRVAHDLMEGCVWPELMDYFEQRYAITEPDDVFDHLGADLRWVGLNYTPPQIDSPPAAVEAIALGSPTGISFTTSALATSITLTKSAPRLPI